MLNNKPGQASRKLAQTTHTHTHKSNNKMQLHALHTLGLALELELAASCQGNHKKLKGLLDLRFY